MWVLGVEVPEIVCLIAIFEYRKPKETVLGVVVFDTTGSLVEADAAHLVSHEGAALVYGCSRTVEAETVRGWVAAGKSIGKCLGDDYVKLWARQS